MGKRYRFKVVPRGYHAMRKKNAAKSIQRLWKNRAKRKRGGLVTRTAKANFEAIKAIRRSIETKYTLGFVAGPTTNWCGQVFSEYPVDNYGMSQQTSDWITAGATATSLPDPKYCPFIVNPVVICQAGQLINAAQDDVWPASESTRTGNDIVMSHLTVKISMTGGNASANGGIYQNVVRKQKVTCLVLLDREPATMNPSLLLQNPTFSEENISCQLYQRTPDNVAAFPGTSNAHRYDTIRESLAKAASANPPGIATKDIGSRNLEAQTFYSKDNVRGKTGRFKVLKKVTLSCYQQSFAQSENINGSLAPTNAYRTLTVKGKYKFHFDSDSDRIPGNQTILLAFYSDTPTVRSMNNTLPQNYCAPPTIAMISKICFKDP